MWSAVRARHFPAAASIALNIHTNIAHLQIRYNESKLHERNQTKMPMYSEIMLTPMREELKRLGIAELRTPEEVDRALSGQPGTVLVIVNSICGCAAGRMRPAVRLALQNATRPERLFSVFAGQDREATDRARTYFAGYP